MKTRHYSFTWMLLPFLILSGLATAMIIERSGVDYQIRYPPMQFLPQQTRLGVQKTVPSNYKTLVLYDSKGFAGVEHFHTVTDVLDSFRVTYDTFDIASGQEFSYDGYEAVIVTFIELNKVERQILDLMDWVGQGGRVLFSIRPDPSSTFSMIYRKLGIISYGEYLVDAVGVTFTSNILPGAEGLTFGTDFIFHHSYTVSLETDCVRHAESADSYHTPLIWECNNGKGKFVVINSDQFISKANRGIIGASYSLLFDVFSYPVINASMFYLDAFPSPIPSITDPTITEEYGRDLPNFLTNIWWPNMKEMSLRYDLLFTSSMLETFSDFVKPPFQKQSEIERHQYFGGLVLDNGGELSLLGYNHVPLCQGADQKNQVLNYPTWPSTEAMELSIFELYSFSKSLFPDYGYVTYVPPSNILCSQARQWLPQVLPDIKVISALYLEGEQGLAYQQEFTEAPDGIIELPRIIAGYDISSYMKWAAINEVGLHYANSQYVQPYEMLMPGSKSWDQLRNELEQYLSWLKNAAPGLRNMTAREGAMAVQRFARVSMTSELMDGSYAITLQDFYDEAWIMLRTNKKPASIEGGTIIQVSSDKYLIKALAPDIKITFSE